MNRHPARLANGMPGLRLTRASCMSPIQSREKFRRSKSIAMGRAAVCSCSRTSFSPATRCSARFRSTSVPMAGSISSIGTTRSFHITKYLALIPNVTKPEAASGAFVTRRRGTRCRTSRRRGRCFCDTFFAAARRRGAFHFIGDEGLLAAEAALGRDPRQG